MRVARKSKRSERRKARAGALIGAAITLVSSAVHAEVANPQGRGLLLKADAATLCALVGKMQVLTLKYNYDPDTAAPRELEPYAVGYTRKGDVLLFGRQLKGYSKSAENGAGELPGWRNFRVDRIKMRVVNAIAETFEPVRPQPATHRTISQFMCEVSVLQ